VAAVRTHFGGVWWLFPTPLVGSWPGRRHPRVDRHPKTSCASETRAAITWASWSQAVDALIMSESRRLHGMGSSTSAF